MEALVILVHLIELERKRILLGRLLKITFDPGCITQNGVRHRFILTAHNLSGQLRGVTPATRTSQPQHLLDLTAVLEEFLLGLIDLVANSLTFRLSPTLSGCRLSSRYPVAVIDFPS